MDRDGFEPEVPTVTRPALALLLLAACAAPTRALDPPPRTLGIQAALESGGAPVVTPTEVTLRLHDASSGGSEVASETATVVPDSNGVFAHALGSITPLDPADFDRPLWLGVTVTGEAEMTPRTTLTGVPYAIRSELADEFSFANLVTLDIEDGGGTLLKDTVAGITDASFGNRYLILLGPGNWDTGDGLQMKSHVHVRGVSRDAVNLNSQGGSEETSATVTMADHSSLANLRASCTGDGTPTYCNAVVFDGAEGRLRGVEVFASGASFDAVGVRVRGLAAEVELDSVEASAATSQGFAAGLSIQNSGVVYATNSTFEGELMPPLAGGAFGMILADQGRAVARNCEFDASGDLSTVTAVYSSSTTTSTLIESLLASTSEDVATCTGVTAFFGGLSIQGGSIRVSTSDSGGTGVVAQSGATVELVGVEVDASRGAAVDETALLAADAGTRLAVVGGRLVAPTIGLTSASGVIGLGSVRVDGTTTDAGLVCVGVFDAAFAPQSCGP